MYDTNFQMSNFFFLDSPLVGSFVQSFKIILLCILGTCFCCPFDFARYNFFCRVYSESARERYFNNKVEELTMN
jgi:hypothetical protein